HRRPPTSPLLPYTTLFRSNHCMNKAVKTVQSVSVGLACFLMLLSWWLPSHFRPWATAYQELLAALALVLTGFAVLFQKKSRISKDRKSTRLNSSHVKISYA